MSDTPRTDEAWDAVSRTPDGRYSTGVPLREYAYAMCEHSKQLERELAEAREQRDGAFSLIDYAGELLGVPKQEHKSAHGFKILQAIKELAAMKGNSR
jgi:hypothetical protein